MNHHRHRSEFSRAAWESVARWIADVVTKGLSRKREEKRVLLCVVWEEFSVADFFVSVERVGDRSGGEDEDQGGESLCQEEHRLFR